MDIGEITQVISTVGFPIVAFTMMYYMCNTTIKEVMNTVNELKGSIDKMVERLGD